MTNRVTEKQIQTLIDRLNDCTGNDREPYGSNGPNAGTYYLSMAYGGYRLDQIAKGGGSNVISSDGYGTKRQLQTFLYGMLNGLETSEMCND